MVKRKRIKQWEWILSLFITGVSGAVIWTNESVDLFSKLGITLKPGIAFLILDVAFMFGLSWISYLMLKKGGLKW
jgi:hypothetical protein